MEPSSMPITEAAIIDDAQARAVEVEETVTDSKQENNGTGAGPANAGNLEQKSVDSVDPTPTCNQPTPTLASLNLEGGQHSSESDTPKAFHEMQSYFAYFDDPVHSEPGAGGAIRFTGTAEELDAFLNDPVICDSSNELAFGGPEASSVVTTRYLDDMDYQASMAPSSTADKTATANGKTVTQEHMYSQVFRPGDQEIAGYSGNVFVSSRSHPVDRGTEQPAIILQPEHQPRNSSAIGNVSGNSNTNVSFCHVDLSGEKQPFQQPPVLLQAEPLQQESPGATANVQEKSSMTAKLETYTQEPTFSSSLASLQQVLLSGILPVRCRSTIGEFHKNKFGSGAKGKCIKSDDKWFTPIEFEAFAGLPNNKVWKRSIRVGDQRLQILFREEYLKSHTLKCKCVICKDTGGPFGHVRYARFRRYKKSTPYVENASERLWANAIRSVLKLDQQQTLVANSVNKSVGCSSSSGAIKVSDSTNVADSTKAAKPTKSPVVVTKAAVPAKVPRSTAPVRPLVATIAAVPKSAGATKVVNTPKVIVAQIIADKPAPSTSIGHGVNPTNSTKVTTENTEDPWKVIEQAFDTIWTAANKVKGFIEQMRTRSTQACSSAKQQETQKQNESRPGKRKQNFDIPQGICLNCGRESFLECSGCGLAHYCSAICQAKDWPFHQVICISEQQRNQSQGNGNSGGPV